MQQNLLKTILLLENIICIVYYCEDSCGNHFLLHRRIRRDLSSASEQTPGKTLENEDDNEKERTRKTDIHNRKG